MDQLWALPIKGESFLLRRGRHSVLVDGGWRGRALAATITAHAPDLRTIDVVVCTHAYGDHAGGLATFLDHWRIVESNGSEVAGTIGQFWLPGSWADVLPQLMADPAGFIDGLVAALDDFPRENPDVATREGDAEDFAEILDPLVRAERPGLAPSEIGKMSVQSHWTSSILCPMAWILIWEVRSHLMSRPGSASYGAVLTISSRSDLPRGMPSKLADAAFVTGIGKEKSAPASLNSG